MTIYNITYRYYYCIYQSKFPLNLDTYLNNCIHNSQKVNSNLGEYIQDPNEKNIHKIRTSIRRLEVSFISSPKQIRKKKEIIVPILKAKKFFSSNSEVRDIDIILEKIQNEGKATQQQFMIFEKTLNDKKKEKLDNAYSLALKIEKKKIPKLYGKKSYHNKKIRKKVIKRISKIIEKYISQIYSMIPIIITDSNKKDQLHKLRKDAKKLRYIFELLIEKEKRYNETDHNNINDEDSSNTEFILKCIEKLEEIQNTIGQIHDYDITLEYLKQQVEYRLIINPIIKNIIDIREKKYKEFVNYCQLDLLNGNSLLYKIKNLIFY